MYTLYANSLRLGSKSRVSRRNPVRKEQNGRELTLQQNINALGNFNYKYQVAELLVKTRLHFTGAI